MARTGRSVRLRSVNRKPEPCPTLGGGEFRAKGDRFAASARGRDVQPFVGLDAIKLYFAASGIHDAEFEEPLRVERLDEAACDDVGDRSVDRLSWQIEMFHLIHPAE